MFDQAAECSCCKRPAMAVSSGCCAITGPWSCNKTIAVQSEQFVYILLSLNQLGGYEREMIYDHDVIKV